MTSKRSNSAKRDLGFSINTDLIDKTPPKNKISFSKGFKPYFTPFQGLVNTIQKGVAYSYVFENGVRKSEYFLGADLLSIDIDGDKTIDEGLNDPIFKKYGALFYTTPSH